MRESYGALLPRAASLPRAALWPRAVFRPGAALLVLLVLLLVAEPAEAQRHGWRRPNPWTFSPYAGLFRDALDIGADGDDTGWQLGFRLGYTLGERTRVTANIGYAESDDVAFTPPSLPHDVFDNQYIITTAGTEYDILPGNTSVALGLDVGGLWRKVAFDERLGGQVTELPPDDDYSFKFALAPGVIVRHGFSDRTALELGIRDYVLLDDDVEHLPAASIGLRFR